MPAYAPFFIGGVGLYLVHRDRRDAYAWGIVAASFLIGQHYAVRELWNASDPNAFAHRTSLGIVLVVAFGFVGGRGDRAGPAELGELALADRRRGADVPLLPGPRASGLGGRSEFLHRSLRRAVGGDLRPDPRVDAAAGPGCSTASSRSR